MQNKENKIPVLDSIRAFSALAVCLFHFVCTTKNFIHNQTINDFFSTGKFGVQSFFVISGFVIPWSMYHSGYKLKHVFKFLYKRFLRLEPPYIVSIILAIIFIWIRNTYYVNNGNETGINLNQIFLHVGYLIPFQETHQWLNSVYWTLAIEFQYYIFMTVAFVLISGKLINLRWLLYALCLGGTFLGSDQLLPFWLPYFLLGIVLYLFKTKQITAVEFGIVIAISFILLFFRYPFFMLIYASIPVFFILFFERMKIIALNSIGKYSYSLYLLHSIIGSAFVNVCSHYVTDSITKFIVIMAGLFISILSAFLLYRTIELPSQRLSSSVKYFND